MLNLNYNIAGGGIQKNQSNFDSRLIVNFEQTSSATLNLNIIGTSSLGYLGDETFEKNYVSTQSAQPLDSFLFDRNSRVKLTLSGSGDWGITQSFPLSPSSSVSLVTMSLEVPYFGLLVTGSTTSSIIDTSFSASISRELYTVNSFVNIDNPTLYMDYLLVGGGGAGGLFFTPSGHGGAGGEAGEFFTGSGVPIKINSKLIISASAGSGGVADPNLPGVPNGQSSSLSFTDVSTNSTVQYFASGGRQGKDNQDGPGGQIGAEGAYSSAGQTVQAECGQSPQYWDNSITASWGGNGGTIFLDGACPISQVPGFILEQPQGPRWGYGGDGGNFNNNNPKNKPGGQGICVVKFYNPDDIINVSGSATIENIGGYTYITFTSGPQSVELSFPEQRYPAP
jgi:hypothetical protein